MTLRNRKYSHHSPLLNHYVPVLVAEPDPPSTSSWVDGCLSWGREMVDTVVQYIQSIQVDISERISAKFRAHDYNERIVFDNTSTQPIASAPLSAPKIPLWIQRYSRVAQALAPLQGQDPLLLLPVCEEDCCDAIELYIVMGAWCIPLADMPHTFSPLWFKLPYPTREALVKLYQYLPPKLV